MDIYMHIMMLVSNIWLGFVEETLHHAVETGSCYWLVCDLNYLDLD
jgi:hypothetical protein